ncbi:MAG: AtpZ/AtpI family protein [FCB group bacterium]|nr:AtpZ/AtpI family protein [FCB group bacterium]
MNDKQDNGQSRGISASYTLLGSLLFFGGLGYWLDSRNEGESYWLLAGLLLGVVIGMYELGKQVFKK